VIAFKIERLAQLAEQLMAIKLQQWSLQSLIVLKKLYLLITCVRIITASLSLSLVVVVISAPLIWTAPAYAPIFSSIALSSLGLTLLLLLILRVAFADKTILRNIELVDTTPPPKRLDDAAAIHQQREELLKQLESLIKDLKAPPV
jgi:hypothetical protein